MIELRNISKSFQDLVIFDDLSVEFTKGNRILIRGENGSGKSVLLKLICGYSKPSSGTITIDGKQLGRDSDFIANAGVSINAPDFIPYLSGEDNLNYLSSINKITDKQFRDYLINKLGMEKPIKKRYSAYSLGMKQKLRFIQAIMERPNIVILDEPLNAMDVDSKAVAIELLKEYIKDDKMLIFTTHEQSHESELANVVYEIYKCSLIRIS